MSSAPPPPSPAQAPSAAPPPPSTTNTTSATTTASTTAPATTSAAPPSSHRSASQLPATSAHPPRDQPDPTVAVSSSSPPSTAAAAALGRSSHAAQGGFAAAAAASAAELARLKVSLRAALRQFPDFPEPGILFEDIMPIFADAGLHDALVRALEVQVRRDYAAATAAAAGADRPVDVVVGLEARGFLFGPSLALRLGVGFVPVRKKGKLPGPTETASYKKEYGEDFFQMQSGGVKPGQRVLIVDDIIATGGSAAAAGSLVRQLGGTLLGYLFILELDFLKGRDKLDAPVHTLLSSQEK